LTVTEILTQNRSDAFLVDLENVHVCWTSLSRILLKNFHGIDPDAATIECHGRQPFVASP